MDNSEEIRQLEEERRQLNYELERYRDDYAILVEQESKILQIAAMAENTDYLVECLDTSISTIEELSAIDQIPHYTEIMNFEDVKSSGDLGSKLRMSNEDYLESLKNTCAEIDTLKTDLANKIYTTTNNIYYIDDRILQLSF